MEYGWNFWLKHSFIISICTKKLFFEIPPFAKKVIFITKFTILLTNPPFYEVKNIFKKGFARGEISEIFLLDHSSSSILSQNVHISYVFHFEYANEVWISVVLGVKVDHLWPFQISRALSVNGYLLALVKFNLKNILSPLPLYHTK